MVRYVNRSASGASVDIGVIAHDLVNKDFAVVFTRDWRHVLLLDPDAELPRLERLEASLRRQFGDVGTDGHALLSMFESSWSNELQMASKEFVEAEDANAAAALVFQERVFRRDGDPKPKN